LTDSAGGLQTEYTYEPFGATTVVGAPSGNAVQFAGRENDGSNIYHNRGRPYHPGIARFIAEDPVGFAGGLNLHVYVSNNPVNFVDPLGYAERVWITYGAEDDGRRHRTD
jgi:RHS repeat-associated protein